MKDYVNNRVLYFFWQREKKHEQQLWEGAELFEFIRVRQNLRKTQTPHKAPDTEADAAEWGAEGGWLRRDAARLYRWTRPDGSNGLRPQTQQNPVEILGSLWDAGVVLGGWGMEWRERATAFWRNGFPATTSGRCGDQEVDGAFLSLLKFLFYI